MAKKFYPATNDNMFKAVFLPKKNRQLLTTFLQMSLKDIVPLNLDSLKVISSELAKTNIKEKGKTLDILAETNDSIINIELNSNYYLGLSNRNATYIFSKYTEEVKVSQGYGKMKLFIQINFTKGLKESNALDVYTLKNQSNNKEYISNLIIAEYDIDKIKEMWYNGDKRYGFIAALDFSEEELKTLNEGDDYMNSFKKEVKRLNGNRRFSEFITAEEDAEKVRYTLLRNARDEGAKENSLLVAEKLLKKNLSIDDIAEVTGLSISEIESLNKA